MPVTPYTRRIFLQKGLTLLGASATVPAFLGRTAWAMADPLDVKNTQATTGKDGKVLVVVQLAGGNDGLNTICPYADDAYYAARPGLAKRQGDLVRLDDHVGLNKAAEDLMDLFGQGWGNVIHGVGYPNPDRSHFRSTDIWESARPDLATPKDGWLGRFFDAQCAGVDPKHPNKPAAPPDATAGVAMNDELPLAMQGRRVTPMTFENPADYQYGGRDVGGFTQVNQVGGGDDNLDFLTRTALDAKASSDRILSAVNGFTSSAQYPANGFGQGLRTTAAMIAANLPTRVYYVTLGGFDTHANQANRHDQLLRQFARGVKAFWQDMRNTGHAERVLMMSFSEFGRRVKQNAGNGTDHGAAAPMFLFGPGVVPGALGRHPSLTNLDNGDLKYTTDFRQVYASVLGGWLDTDSRPILGDFQPVPVLGT